jgi:DNA polymerase III epsilon subunit family exonuclease
MKYVVFDIETTGLDTKKDRILEIGAVKVENGIVIDEFNKMMNPGISIPPHVSEINHIYDHMVCDKPHPGVVLQEFYNFYKDCDYIIGHNAKKFDYPFLTQEYIRYMVKVEPFTVKDTMWVARSKIKGLRSYSLKALCNIYGVTNKDAHRALSDVYATHEVYLKLLEK